MKRLIPSKKVREEFLLTYELRGAQRAIDFLADYYGVRRIKMILDGRRVGRGYKAWYDNNVGYFTKKGFNRRIVLHEFYHHLVFVRNLNMESDEEEKAANNFVTNLLKK